jgi:hypothetical protein
VRGRSGILSFELELAWDLIRLRRAWELPKEDSGLKVIQPVLATLRPL